MSQDSFQITKINNNKKKPHSNLNQFTSTSNWRNFTLTRIFIIYNVYTMRDFKLAEKNLLAVFDNSGHLLLHH